MLLSVRDLSAILRVPEGTVYRWVRDRGLPAREVNGHYRTHPVDLLEWLADHPVPVDPRALPTDGPVGVMPSLEAAIRAGGVYHDLPGVTRETALASFSSRLPQIPGLPAEDLHRLLLRKESIGTAYLEEGIAVPHPRYPLILSTVSPMLAVGFPAELVSWDDARHTIRALFTLITPTVRDHLRLLGRLIFALHDPRFKDLITHRAAAAQVFSVARDLDHVTTRPPITPVEMVAKS